MKKFYKYYIFFIQYMCFIIDFFIYVFSNIFFVYFNNFEGKQDRDVIDEIKYFCICNENL